MLFVSLMTLHLCREIKVLAHIPVLPHRTQEGSLRDLTWVLWDGAEIGLCIFHLVLPLKSSNNNNSEAFSSLLLGQSSGDLTFSGHRGPLSCLWSRFHKSSRSGAVCRLGVVGAEGLSSFASLSSRSLEDLATNEMRRNEEETRTKANGQAVWQVCSNQWCQLALFLLGTHLLSWCRFSLFYVCSRKWWWFQEKGAPSLKPSSPDPLLLTTGSQEIPWGCQWDEFSKELGGWVSKYS